MIGTVSSDTRQCSARCAHVPSCLAFYTLDMGFASPATVLLWVLALRPSAGTDAIMVPPRRSGDLLEVEDKACARWQQQLVSSPTAMPEHSECIWFVGLIGIHNASALGELGAASRRTGNHRAADLGDGSHLFSGRTALGTFNGASAHGELGAASRQTGNHLGTAMAGNGKLRAMLPPDCTAPLVAFEGALVAFEGAAAKLAVERAADRHEPPHPAKLAGLRAADEREPLHQHGASVENKATVLRATSRAAATARSMVWPLLLWLCRAMVVLFGFWRLGTCLARRSRERHRRMEEAVTSARRARDTARRQAWTSRERARCSVAAAEASAAHVSAEL